MRLQNYLGTQIDELWMKDRKKNSVEILINPSLKEARYVIKNSKGDKIRFIAHKKDIYVWDAYVDILHDDFWRKQGRDLKNDINDNIIFPGYAILKSGKLVMHGISPYVEGHLQDWDNEKVYDDRLSAIEKEFKWVNNYIDISGLREYIEKEWK